MTLAGTGVSFAFPFRVSRCVVQSRLANFIFLINTGPLFQQNLNSAWNESMSGRFQVFAQFPAVFVNYISFECHYILKHH
ncbi:hypothetical protein SAMN05216387_102195 [Nitrosovibrio tenuis]|uniref:Uncharacterized protein n=1 Tax=Nitrosovibrio tenuis TaxID=1233 RepID=A0A1H7IPA5_9PROT|nr:hypothetical protein SAMN05216387_102195 [Nitrosovibrio tenuis]